MSYPPVVIFCHCTPAFTVGLHIGLPRATLSCHHFLPSLSFPSLPGTVQLCSLTSPRKGAALSWLTKPMADQALQHGIPLGGDCSASQSVETCLGMCPKGFQAKILSCAQHFTELELLSSFFPASLVKLQIANTSSTITTCRSLCKFCCDLWSKVLTFPDASLVPLCPLPYRMGAGMCIYKSQDLGADILV